jgi:hypothetical protein
MMNGRRDALYFIISVSGKKMEPILSKSIFVHFRGQRHFGPKTICPKTFNPYLSEHILPENI